MAKVMFCFSTQNQTVNLIPALQEKETVDKIVMFSTKKAKIDGWTENFKSIIDAHPMIDCEYLNISKYEEEIIELADKITEEVRQHDSLKDFDCLKDFADKVNRIIENKEALRNVGKLANDIIEKAKKHTDLDEFKSVKKLAEEINAKIKEKEVLKINELRDKILEVVNRYAVDQNEIQLNIGGGQKIHTLALIEAWKKCEYENTKLVYSEANERTLYSITKDSMLTTKQTTSGYKVGLSLKEILRSYGYELHESSDSNIEIPMDRINDFLNKNNYSSAKKASEYLYADVENASDKIDGLAKEVSKKLQATATEVPEKMNEFAKELSTDLYAVAKEISEKKIEQELYQKLFYRKMMNEEVDETISYDELIHGDLLQWLVGTYEPNLNEVLPEYKRKKKKIDVELRTEYMENDIKTILERIRNFKKSVPKEQVPEDKLKDLEEQVEIIKKKAEGFVEKYGTKAFMDRIIKDLAAKISNNFREEKIYNIPVVERHFNADEQEKIKKMFCNVKFDPEGYLYLGGEYSYSFGCDKNGEFFEKMVTSEVCKLKDEAEAWENIHEIRRNVKTKQIGSKKNENDAEYDVVIVTKFGTLILLEAKSAKFDNKIAKGQERDVFQKSGPYGRATIVGPLLKEMLNASKKERRDKYPFVDKAFYDQTEKVESAGMTYWCFDEIVEKLKNLLKNK